MGKVNSFDQVDLSEMDIDQIAKRCRSHAIFHRRGGRSEKYQRDGETGWFYVDEVLALADWVSNTLRNSEQDQLSPETQNPSTD